MNRYQRRREAALITHDRGAKKFLVVVLVRSGTRLNIERVVLLGKRNVTDPADTAPAVPFIVLNSEHHALGGPPSLAPLARMTLAGEGDATPEALTALNKGVAWYFQTWPTDGLEVRIERITINGHEYYRAPDSTS